MEVSALPDAASHILYPEFLAMLETAVTDGGKAFDPAIDTMWIAYEGKVVWGAATTRIRTDGVARLHLAGGKRFRDWIGPLDEAVSQWARRRGCDLIVMRGRKGWQRYADRFGWASSAPDEDGMISFEKAV